MSIATEITEAPTDTGATDDRKRLGRVIGQVLIAAVAFLLTAAVWEYVTIQLHARPEIPEPFKTKIDLCFNSGQYDTAFIGSSRYFHGIDPVAFDAETARLGTTTHSFNLGFDALNFPELQFLVHHVLSDPRSHIKTLFIEPSMRVRLAPGLEHSQRALTLHDEIGSRNLFEFILKSNHDWKRKLFWLYQHASVSVVRLTNVGALTNRYVRPQEPAPDLADLDGPMHDGYSGLDPNIPLGPQITAADIKQMVADQNAAETNGSARQLNNFEINQLIDLQKFAAEHGVRLILLAPPTASPEVFDEFRAMVHASQSGKLTVPLMSFADPVAYPDLYEPKGFADPDHINQPVAKRWSVHAADSFVNHTKTPKPVSWVPEEMQGRLRRQVRCGGLCPPIPPEIYRIGPPADWDVELAYGLQSRDQSMRIDLAPPRVNSQPLDQPPLLAAQCDKSRGDRGQSPCTSTAREAVLECGEKV